ncbi:MAG TPA: creatininase family protein [Thermoplasmata archaeon]|nr:creatininase family protein [Thermoplasmata archaeon]
MVASRRLRELDSRTFERRLAENPLVILPIGALEAHGPHLPLGSDEVQAEVTALALAERIDGLVAPTIPYGSCPGTRGFPGTVSLSMAPLGEFVRAVLSEFGRMGVRRILVLSGHAERGHIAALREAADAAMLGSPALRIAVLSDYDFVYERRGLDAPSADGHAGLLETSRMMALAPTMVGSERPVVERKVSPFRPGSPPGAEWPESVQGDTRAANRDPGDRVQGYVLERLVATVRELL